MLPIVFELLQPATVVEFGCGVGTWLSVAKRLGATRVRGLDGAYARNSGLLIDASELTDTDLSQPVPAFPERFDLALSLEVAEHLPTASSDRFVADLCAAADVVLFGAAIFGQDGTDHINLQPQSAWISRFAAQGFQVFDLVRPRVWSHPAVKFWYKQNSFVFVNNSRTDLIERATTLAGAAGPLVDVAHPDLVAWWARRAARPMSAPQAARYTAGALVRAVTRRLPHR